MFYDKNTDKLREECGLFGIYNRQEDVALLTKWGLYALQHRGQEGAGIAVADGKLMEIHRGMGLASHVFSKGLPNMKGHIAIGHVRYSTVGSSLPHNNQPLMVNYAGGQISMAHNGNLTNAQEIRKKLESQGSVFQTSIDSEVIVNLIARSKEEDIHKKISDSVIQLKGAYCLLVMTKDKLIGVRDPHGFRPLCLGKLGEGWVIASESCALDTVGANFYRDVEPGEIVVIDQDGLTSHKFAQSDRLARCVFEHVYFARADSVLDGKSVHEARTSMGKILARESSLKADIVISVPDSGTTAAIGFSQESGIPFAEGLVKNRYIGRTFIQPEQQKRETSVHLKLNPVGSVVKNKSVIMVDDSIVRGTTSGKIVRMLREAGAREIHMCISSPPVEFPCYYGIDTSVSDELIASTKPIEEIRTFIGADSLAYLSLGGLCEAIGKNCEKTLCTACFNGDYPTNIPSFGLNFKSKYIFEPERI